MTYPSQTQPCQRVDVGCEFVGVDMDLFQSFLDPDPPTPSICDDLDLTAL